MFPILDQSRLPFLRSGIVLTVLLSVSACASRAGSNASLRNPEFVKARDRLVGLLEGTKTTAKWVVANHITPRPGHGGWRLENSILMDLEVAYSNCSVTSKGEFQCTAKGRERHRDLGSNVKGPAETTRQINQTGTISLRKTNRVFTHNQPYSVESKNRDPNIVVDIVCENLNQTWTVELVSGTDYKQIFFPNKRTAESFVEAWTAVAALMK